MIRFLVIGLSCCSMVYVLFKRQRPTRPLERKKGEKIAWEKVGKVELGVRVLKEEDKDFVDIIQDFCKTFVGEEPPLKSNPSNKQQTEVESSKAKRRISQRVALFEHVNELLKVLEEQGCKFNMLKSEVGQLMKLIDNLIEEKKDVCNTFMAEVSLRKSVEQKSEMAKVELDRLRRKTGRHHNKMQELQLEKHQSLLELELCQQCVKLNEVEGTRRDEIVSKIIEEEKKKLIMSQNYLQKLKRINVQEENVKVLEKKLTSNLEDKRDALVIKLRSLKAKLDIMEEQEKVEVDPPVAGIVNNDSSEEEIEVTFCPQTPKREKEMDEVDEEEENSERFLRMVERNSFHVNCLDCEAESLI